MFTLISWLEVMLIRFLCCKVTLFFPFSIFTVLLEALFHWIKLFLKMLWVDNSDTVSMVFFPSFYFSTHLCLYMEWISHKQHITGYCFYIQSDNLCFLIEVFIPFIFNIIIDLIVFMSVSLLFVFYLLFLYSSLPIFLGG